MADARYVKLLRSIWSDPEFRTLDHTAQWMYMALISQPDMSAAGVLPLVERRWAGLADDLDIGAIAAALDRLEAAAFIVVDPETGELWVRSYIRHDGLYRSPNGRKAVDNAIAGLLSPTIAQLACDAARGLAPDGHNPRSTAPAEGASEGSTGGVSPPQQPAASSHETAASSRSQQPLTQPLDEFTATVVDHLIGQRLRQERNIRSPSGYRKALQRELPPEHGDRIAELHTLFPTAPASSIAAAVLTGDTRPLAPHAT